MNTYFSSTNSSVSSADISESLLNMLPDGFTPSENDVLCGRGKALSRAPGNQKFSQAVRATLPAYIEATRRVDKSIVVASLVTELRAKGFRFVKKDANSTRYYELTEDQIHEKTGHAIRDLLKEGRKKELRRARSLARQTKAKLKKSGLSPPSSSEEDEPTPNTAMSSTVSSYSTSPVPPTVPSSGEIEPPTIRSSSILSFNHRQSSVFTGGMADTLMDVLFTEDDKKPAAVAMAAAAKRRQSSIFAPLPLSSDTNLVNSDIFKVFEILSDDSDSGVC